MGCWHTHPPGSSSKGAYTPLGTGSEIHSLHPHMYPHSDRDLMHTRLFLHCIWGLGKGMLNTIRFIFQFRTQSSVSNLLTQKLTCEAWFAYTVITIDAIFANAIVTWVTGTIVKIDLTVGACVEEGQNI